MMSAIVTTLGYTYQLCILDSSLSKSRSTWRPKYDGKRVASSSMVHVLVLNIDPRGCSYHDSSKMAPVCLHLKRRLYYSCGFRGEDF